MSSVKKNFYLAKAPPGQEVVITGMAGRFPDSDDISAFRENLYNKVDLVSDDNRRWELTHPEIPQRTGKINHVNKFDAGFFGVHHRQAHTMDPMCRMLIERTFEAIVDAGMNPKELEGSSTGVFVGACFSETEKSSFYEKLTPQNYGIPGCTRSMLAQRISYVFQLEGPSFVSDTACSSSLFAFEHAYKAIREGRCDTAIVGGCNLCLHPVVSMQFARLGVLSPDGACKSFDNSANGYARSEAVAALVLQRAQDSRRIYAEVIHSKTNCDGFKEQGITYPSGKIQKVLLDEFYEECGVPPNSLTFVEAHGTGTKVGDPEELGTLDEVFCTGRNRPLHIGSVKSNIGHNEPVSGICSIVKVVIGMENGFLPPNIHYKEPRQGVEALEKGRMKVVSEKTPIPDNRGLFGINSFGFGGANSHLLLRWNRKVKENWTGPVDSMPRLVCLSGRNERFLENMFEFLEARGFDTEYIALLHEIFKFEIYGNYSRGFAVIGKNKFWTSTGETLDDFPLPLSLFFSGIDGKWASCIRTLQTTPIFAAHLQRLENIIFTKNLPLNITDLVNNYNESDPVHSTIATVIAQTGLIDLLKLLQLSIDNIDGVNLGELAAAYARGQLDLEQTLLATYYASIANPKSASVFVLEHFGRIMPQQLAVHLSKTLFNPKPKPSTPPNSNTLIIGNAENLSKRTTRLIGNSFEDLLTSLGRLYELGYNFHLGNLYPPVEFPVSRGTPMVSPLIRWDHSKDWFVTVYKAEDKTKSGYRVVEIGLRDDDWSFIRGHVIDGRHLFPATGYLNLAWETLGIMTGQLLSDINVVFEDVRFMRACTLSSKVKLELSIMIQRGGGNFEVVEGGNCVVSGRIYEVENIEEEFCKLPIPTEDNSKKLTEKDVYKELRLRGYNYKEQFKAVKEYDLENNCGKIAWTGNWMAFMDNLLQLSLLQEDTRNLYVPTRIERLVVDPKKHIALAKSHQNLIPAYVYKDLNILKAGAIEIRGLNASSIARRKQAEPVLEIHKFVPNKHEFPLEESIRILVQLALENHNAIKVKTVELQSGSDTIISPLVLETLADLPLIQSEIFVHLDRPIEVPKNITVDDRKFGAEIDCHFAIATGILANKQLRRSVLSVIKPAGFVISREQRPIYCCEDLKVLAVHKTPCEVLVLAQKRCSGGPQSVIRVDSSFDWLAQLQKTESEVLLYSQNTPLSGILGLVNCLRREPNGERIKCVFILDSAPPFDPTTTFYKEQLEKGMAVNIYKQGQWGTYRHLLLGNSLELLSEHCYVNVTTRGDLSSLRWIQGGLTSKSVLEPEKTLVHIYCAAINFRDIMTASGRIQNDVVTRNRLEQDCIQGFEFAGRDPLGRRVMGMVVSNAMATMVSADSYLLWAIPDHWTMEEAVTVPAVYGTVIYGLLMRAKLQYGQSILIHSGTGGVGQAAINICLHYGCKIFVTVGTEEKRDFIKRNFPRIRACNIGCSRDCGFEQMIYKQTNGRGVDLVLNSLAEDKLQASIRCLAEGGKFLEIGKFDLANDSPLSLTLAAKKCYFHGIMLDHLFKSDPIVKEVVTRLLLEGIKSGAIKPLPRTCFRRNEIEQAFRFMATGKHIGKVLIRIRQEEAQVVRIPQGEKFSGIPRFSCDSESCYVIIGGLGGFGLELVDWLALRGARKFVLNSRKGLTTGYQSFRIKIWKSYGAIIHISTKNIQIYKDVVSLLEEAEALGPVKSIFNLAVDLRDGILENQTVTTFNQSAGPKAVATQHLDTASRHVCPNLENFVVFSSVSCGRGNAGQTNYGWSNSVMERICEKRKACNLPALAIQWGAIGDVGLVAEMQEEHQDLIIGGTLQQRISSCLEVLDKFLRQEETVVGSMVVAEKRSSAAGADNIVDAVVAILGLRDLKTVSPHSSFPELGMDSMMAVEIKQTLEREYEVFLTPQDIRCMTFSRLQEIATEKTTEPVLAAEDLPKGIKLLLRFIANEEESKLESVVIPSLSSGTKTAFLLPGIEGMASVFLPLAKNLKARAFCIQLPYEKPSENIIEMAQQLLPIIEEQLSSQDNFTVIAYSFGCGVALELTHLLEKTRRGTLILLDGAPAFMKRLIENQLEIATESEFQTSLLCALMSVYIPYEIIAQYKVALLKCANYEERIQFALAIAPKNMIHTQDYIKLVCLAAYKRAKAIYQYLPSFKALVSEVILFRPLNSSVLDIAEDYQLSSITGSNVRVRFFEGDHVSILENVGVVEEINRVMEGGDVGKGMEEVPVVVKQTIS